MSGRNERAPERPADEREGERMARRHQHPMAPEQQRVLWDAFLDDLLARVIRRQRARADQAEREGER